MPTSVTTGHDTYVPPIAAANATAWTLYSTELLHVVRAVNKKLYFENKY